MPADLNSFGAPARFKYGPIGRDRHGVITATIMVDRHEDADQVDISLLFPGNEPPFIVPCQNAVRSYKNGIATYTYAYEGGPPNFEFGERVFCALEGTDSSEPIETHINFPAIALKYNAQYEHGQFSHFARKLKSGAPNPVYGARDFLSLGLVWTYTITLRELPVGECERTGCIDDPQGHAGMQPPRLGGRRNWLRCAPQARQRGNVIELTRKWMASGRNGWNKDFYSDKGVANGGAQNGLTTNSIQGAQGGL